MAMKVFTEFKLFVPIKCGRNLNSASFPVHGYQLASVGAHGVGNEHNSDFDLKTPGKGLNYYRVGWFVWQIKPLDKRLSGETLSTPRGGKRINS